MPKTAIIIHDSDLYLVQHRLKHGAILSNVFAVLLLIRQIKIVNEKHNKTAHDTITTSIMQACAASSAVLSSGWAARKIGCLRNPTLNMWNFPTVTFELKEYDTQ